MCGNSAYNEERHFSALQSIKYKKAPGYDLITPKILKEIPSVGITLITYTFLMLYCERIHSLSNGKWRKSS